MKFHVIILLLITIWIKTEGRVFHIPGYTYYPELKGYLSYHAVPVTWNTARFICQLEGGVLASPTDLRMRELLIQLMNMNKCPIFTGLSSTIGNLTYVSDEGIPLSKIPVVWAPNEPDNFNNTEQCLILLSNGTMADEQCSQVFPYVCRVNEGKGDRICNTHYTGYVYSDLTGHCYKHHNTPKTWDDAYVTCAAEGGQLVVLDSHVETDFVREILPPQPNITSTVYKNIIYVGFRSWYRHGSWMAVTGDKLQNIEFENWRAGEPNNYGGHEYCVVMHLDDGKWVDCNCDWNLTFVCELTP